jgi:hypothetical protein
MIKVKGENRRGIECDGGYFDGVYETGKKCAVDFLETMTILFEAISSANAVSAAGRKRCGRVCKTRPARNF